MDRKKLKERLKKDTRTKEEIFQELVAQMKGLSKTGMSDDEAAEAARNLIGFYTTLFDAEYENVRNKRSKQQT